MAQQPKPRSLPKVVERILQVVPANKPELRARLRSIRESAICAAPEAQYIWWHELCGALGENLHDPTTPAARSWEREVSAIITGKKS